MRRTTPSSPADAYFAWIGKNGSVPSTVSTDPAERAVAVSFRNFRGKGQAITSGEPELTAAQAEVAPGKPRRATKRRSSTPLGVPTAIRIADFYEANGRLPLNRNQSEKPLYSSLRNMRYRAKHGLLAPEALKIVSSIPGFSTVVRLPPLPELEKLEAWCGTHGRLPRHTIKSRTTDAEELEQHLGRWLYRHINRRHDPVETSETQMIRDQILALQDLYPQTNKANAVLRANTILQFIEKAGRLPDLAHEPELYRQCFALKRRFADSARTGDAINTVLEATSELPSHLESQWDARMSDVEAFVQAHGKLPARGSKGAVERSLIRWLYAAGMVQDPVRVSRLDSILNAGTEKLAA